MPPAEIRYPEMRARIGPANGQTGRLENCCVPGGKDISMPKTRDAKPCRLDPRPLPEELIGHRILTIRDQKIILDRDLAMVYEVKAIALRQQVKRNADRFPEDFMFQLSDQETNALLSQNAIPSLRSMGDTFPMLLRSKVLQCLAAS